MNFGAGPNGGNQNLPPFNPMTQGPQIPPVAMPVYPTIPVMPMPMPMSMPMPMPMSSMHPAMMPPPPIQTSYPAGQGPLADRPLQRGANGLYVAPAVEAPEQHDATQYVRLNPAEELKYSEYWGHASEGADTVSGSHAVEFLSRASNVSKGQLRRIWDLADHRKEGALEQNQFYIALRLLALAQRGAELSISALRNFTGIQLIPSIDPPPDPEPEQPTPSSQHQKPLFSWTITAEVAARYDNFFKTLDVRNADVIDGKQGVTFFGKSGLPRPTLKKIWGLADVTRDGLLSLDEFRTAMHMVTCIRNKRLDVSSLPDALDPAGPNWLRIAGADHASLEAPGLEGQNISATSPRTPEMGRNDPQGFAAPPQSPQSFVQPAQPTPGQMMQPSPPQYSQVPRDHDAQYSSPHANVPLSPGPGNPSQYVPQMTTSNGSPSRVESAHRQPKVNSVQAVHPGSSPIIPGPPEPLPSQQESIPQTQHPVSDVTNASTNAAVEEANSIREALRKERLENEIARREMEEMKAEMERLRIEKQAFTVAQSATSAVPDGITAPPSMYGQGLSASQAFPSSSIRNNPVAAPLPAQQSPPPNLSQTAVQPSTRMAHVAQHAVAPSAVGSSITSSDAAPYRGQRPQGKDEASSTGQHVVPPGTPNVPNRDKPIDLGMDDDEIWDQPSPKASALPGPSQGSRKIQMESKDGVSSDDDDDFWGTSLGPKPSLGSAGGQKPGESKTNGFGGSELDDWVF